MDEPRVTWFEYDRDILAHGALLFLVLLAFALRVPGLNTQSMWRDEVDALSFSQAPLSTLLSNFSRPGWNGPLYYVILRGWVALTGRTAFALRSLSLLLSVLGVAALYRLGRAWFSPLVGGIAALLMACAPYMVWYAQEAKMYAMLCTVAILTLHVYRRALESADWHLWPIVVAGIWITAGLHVIGALILPLMALLLGLWWPLARGRSAKQAGIALGAGALPLLLVLPWALKLLWRGGNIGHAFVPLGRMVATMLYAFGRGVTPTGGLWPIGLVIFFTLAGTLLWPDARQLGGKALAALEGRRTKVGELAYVCSAWAWLAIPTLGLYLISLRVPMFVDRYLIWIGGAVYLLMARGYDQLRKRMAFFATLCLAALLALNGWAILVQSTTIIKSDFRGAAAFVCQHRRQGELVLFHISYIEDTFEYYYGEAIPSTGGIPTDEKTTPQAVDREMRARTEGHRVVWLVLSEPEMWDARGMTVAWLDAHGHPDLRADLTRVSVVRYLMHETQ